MRHISANNEPVTEIQFVCLLILHIKQKHFLSTKMNSITILICCKKKKKCSVKKTLCDTQMTFGNNELNKEWKRIQQQKSTVQIWHRPWKSFKITLFNGAIIQLNGLYYNTQKPIDHKTILTIELNMRKN